MLYCGYVEPTWGHGHPKPPLYVSVLGPVKVVGPGQICMGVNRLGVQVKFIRADHVPGTVLRGLYLYLLI